MHCLEVIVDRNTRAAAREEAEAVMNGDVELAARIEDANPDIPFSVRVDAHRTAQEG